jgi:MFS family permease
VSLLPAPGPLRPLALSTLLSRIANGVLMTVSVLYFNRIVGLGIAEIGLGLTIAGLVALGSGVPLGHLADLRGPRLLFVLLSIGTAIVSLAYLAVGGFWQFVAVATAVAVLDRGANAVRFALIAAVTTDSRARVTARAYLRAITNVGVAIGAALGAVALQADSAAAYRLMFGLYAGLGVVAALVVLTIPPVRPQPRRAEGPVWVAVRDRGYLAVAGLNAAISIYYAVVDVAIPIWVVDHTEAPRPAVAGVLFVNAGLVALFQVRAARGIVDTRSAARATRRAGLLLMSAMLLFAGASGGGPGVAVALLAVGAVVLTLGELLHSAGSFLLGFDLAAEHAQGQYLGLWHTGASVSTMVAPVVLALLPLGLGVPGWVVLGAAFAVIGALFVPVVRWAHERQLTSAATAPALP